MKINGILMEITGIQPYIFGSNKLRMNIGASDIVEKVFSSIENIIDQLKFTHNDDISKLFVKDIDIIFRGGGNIMMVSKELEKLRSVARNWHKNLFENYPGLNTNLATSSIESDGDTDHELQELLIKLRDQLFQNKNSYHPITVPMGLGINSICKYTGYPAELIKDIGDDKRKRISAVVNAKIEQFEKANNELAKEYRDALNNHNFILNLDEFRRKNEAKSNYLSIVHIDGNSIGDKFKECDTIHETINLSTELERLVKSAFEHITEIMVKRSKSNNIALRPIIIGGDDITFITNYKYGIFLAMKFIEFIKKENTTIENLEFSAGIAIVKIKYPFARAYELAERLCSKAKENARKEGGSWINFVVNGTGFTGDINSVIDKYDVPEGNLLFRPYSLNNKNTKNLGSILEGARELKNNWPKNKINGFEKVLHRTKNEIQMFVKEVEHRGHKLPVITGNIFEKYIFMNRQTPYYDMIELIEFYPLEELK